MGRTLFILMFSLVLGSCQTDFHLGEPQDIIRIQDQSIPVYSFEEFAPILKNRNKTTYVINFWATWCGPCVKEIPHFVEVSKTQANTSFKWIYVSLDDVANDSLIVQVSEQLEIINNTLVIDETDFNSWISKVDPNWSGALPATVIYNSDYRRFKEGALNRNALESLIQEANNSLN